VSVWCRLADRRSTVNVTDGCIRGSRFEVRYSRPTVIRRGCRSNRVASCDVETWELPAFCVPDLTLGLLQLDLCSVHGLLMHHKRPKYVFKLRNCTHWNHPGVGHKITYYSQHGYDLRVCLSVCLKVRSHCTRSRVDDLLFNQALIQALPRHRRADTFEIALARSRALTRAVRTHLKCLFVSVCSIHRAVLAFRCQ